MNDTEQKEIIAEAPVEEVVADDVVEVATTTEAVAMPARSQRAGGRGGRTGGSRERRPSSRPPRAKSEFDQRIINIRRVARVMAGGRRFSFSVSMIIGNKKGKVGVGVGKAGDTTLAIDKAARAAKKSLITLTLTKDSSIRHDVQAKFCASLVSLQPASGRGLVAGSSVRPVLELAGVTNVVAKVHSGSKNGLNNARAAIEALKKLKA